MSGQEREAARSHPEKAGGSADVKNAAATGSGAVRPAKKPRAKNAASAKKGAKEFTPLANAKQAILAFGAAHPALVCAGSALAVIAMGVLLVWFECFSGYNAPKQFVYAGF